MARASHHVSAASFLRGGLRGTVRLIKRICRFNSRNNENSSTRSPEPLTERTTLVQLENLPTENIEPTDTPIYQDGPAKQSGSAGKVEIFKIETVLRAFKGVADVFPPLATTVDEIISCLHIAEAAQNYGEDYKCLSLELETMTKTLDAIIGELGYDPEDQEQGLVRLSRSVNNQARQLSKLKRQHRGKAFKVFAARRHEAYVIECHRRIRTWLLQLQAQTNFIMIRDSRTHLRITLLQRLFPVECSKYSEVAKHRSHIQDTAIDVSDDIDRWVSNDSSPNVYWVTGAASARNTTIAYSLSKRLDEEGRLGASFFCSEDPSACSDPSRIIPTIAYQLAQYSRTFQQSLFRVLETGLDVRTLSVERQLDILILDILRDTNQRNTIGRHTVIVIDALEKCTDQTTVGRIVSMLVRHDASFPFKVFVTSRPAPDQGTPLSAVEGSPSLQLYSCPDYSKANRALIYHTHGMPVCQSSLCGTGVQSSRCDRHIPLNPVTGVYLEQRQHNGEQNVIGYPLVRRAYIEAGPNTKNICLGTGTLVQEKLSTQGLRPCSGPTTETSSPQFSDYPEPLDFEPLMMDGFSMGLSRIQQDSRCCSDSALGVPYVPNSSEDSCNKAQNPASHTNIVKSETQLRRNSMCFLSVKKNIPAFLINILVFILMATTIIVFTSTAQGALSHPQAPHSPDLGIHASLSTLSLNLIQTRRTIHIETPVSMRSTKVQRLQAMVPIHEPSPSLPPVKYRICSVASVMRRLFNVPSSRPTRPPETAEIPVRHPSHATFSEWKAHSRDDFRPLSTHLGPRPPVWPLEPALHRANQTDMAAKDLHGVMLSHERVKHVTDKLDEPDDKSVHSSDILNVNPIGSVSLPRSIRKLEGQMALAVRVCGQQLMYYPAMHNPGDKLKSSLDDHQVVVDSPVAYPTSWTLHDFRLIKIAAIFQAYKMGSFGSRYTRYTQLILSGLFDKSRNIRDMGRIHGRMGAPFGLNSSNKTGNVWEVFNKNDTELPKSSIHDSQPRID